MDIVNKKLDQYMLDLIPPRDEVLAEMERYGEERDFPLIGPLCGRFLQQMALVTGARNIFEMGSGYGYSAVWFARGMPEEGSIICTDGDQENKARALQFFRRAGVAQKIEFHVGMAQEILQRFDGPFDIIFNDIDKHEYPEIIDLAIPKLRQGGLFITDNALWYGKVVNRTGDKYTLGVQEFNRRLYRRKDLLTTILPIRDGLAVSVKL